MLLHTSDRNAFHISIRLFETQNNKKSKIFTVNTLTLDRGFIFVYSVFFQVSTVDRLHPLLYNCKFSHIPYGAGQLKFLAIQILCFFMMTQFLVCADENKCLYLCF